VRACVRGCVGVWVCVCACVRACVCVCVCVLIEILFPNSLIDAGTFRVSDSSTGFNIPNRVA
jgi:hypothetical protein